MHFPVLLSLGKCIPFLDRIMGRNFPLERLWESVSHFDRPEWDALSAKHLNGKLRPIPKANSGTHFSKAGTADDFLDRYAALPSAARNSAGVRPPSASLRLSVLYRPIQPPSSSMKRAGVQPDQSLPCQNSFLSRPKKPSIAALSGLQPLADWIGYADVDSSGRGARDGKAVCAFLRDGRGEGLPGYGA